MKNEYALEVAVEFLRTGYALDASRLKTSVKVANALSLNPALWEHFEGDLDSVLNYVKTTTGRKRKGVDALFLRGLDCKGPCCTRRVVKKIKIQDF